MISFIKPNMVWFGLYICPDKPKPIYWNGWAKEKVQMGVELGGSYLDAITELVTMRHMHRHFGLTQTNLNIINLIKRKAVIPGVQGITAFHQGRRGRDSNSWIGLLPSSV